MGMIIAETTQQSSVLFGGYDSGMMASQIYWQSLVKNSIYWELEMNGADYGDESFMTTGTSAIIDSGTSLLALPN